MKLPTLPRTDTKSVLSKYILEVNNSNLNATFFSYKLNREVFSDEHGKVITLITNEFYDPVHEHSYVYLTDSVMYKLGVFYRPYFSRGELGEVHEMPVCGKTDDDHVETYSILHNRVVVGFLFVAGFSHNFMAKVSKVEEFIQRP